MDEQDTFLEKMDMYLLGGEVLPSISQNGPDAQMRAAIDKDESSELSEIIGKNENDCDNS